MIQTEKNIIFIKGQELITYNIYKINKINKLPKL